MGREDFVDVKLSAAGEEYSGGHLAVRGGGYEYVFETAMTVRMTAAEFRARLAEIIFEGKAVFEIVEPERGA